MDKPFGGGAGLRGAARALGGRSVARGGVAPGVAGGGVAPGVAGWRELAAAGPVGRLALAALRWPPGALWRGWLHSVAALALAAARRSACAAGVRWVRALADGLSRRGPRFVHVRKSYIFQMVNGLFMPRAFHRALHALAPSAQSNHAVRFSFPKPCTQ